MKKPLPQKRVEAFFMETVCHGKLFHTNFSNRPGYDGPGYGHTDQKDDQDDEHADVPEDEGPDNPCPVVFHNDDIRAVLVFF